MTISNSWGVPDWQDADAYPSPTGRARMLVWAWEFLRRNPEYRTFWLERASKFVRPGGHIDGDYYPVAKEAEERFGVMLFPLDPAQSKPPKFSANFIKQIRPASDFQPFSMSLEQHEIGYLFDMTRPLEGQFARALKDAKALQAFRVEKGKGKFKNPRERSENFVSYLRILDADEAEADNRTIAATLYPNLSNERPDYHGNNRLKDHRERARELRDSDYRLLAALAIAPGNAREASGGI